MMAKLEADRDMELNERQKLEEEIRAKQEEIEKVKTVVDSKDDETKKLQEEMMEAKRQLEVCKSVWTLTVSMHIFHLLGNDQLHEPEDGGGQPSHCRGYRTKWNRGR